MSSTGNLKHSKPAIRSRAAVKRAVPVATALKTLVPAKKHVASHAAIVQQPKINNQRWSIWSDVALAAVLALGLSAVFMSPLRFSGTTSIVSTDNSQKIVTTRATSATPGAVSVTVKIGGHEQRVVTDPKNSSLAEALGQAAGAAGTSFEYSSRGSSIYLSKFFDVDNSASGNWKVSVNGLAVSDLSSRPLEPGDEVIVEHQTI